MENEELEKALLEIEKEIASLPKGYISTKKINGKEQCYQQWWAGKKKQSKYLRPSIVLETKEKIARRKELEKEEASLLAEIKGRKEGKKSAPMMELDVNVFTSMRLRVLLLSCPEKKRRDLFKDLENYLYGKNEGKVLVLYGLRRSGKSTLIRQALKAMKEEDFALSAYIQVIPSMDLASLFTQLSALQELHYRYVFIDEVTLLDDFIEGAAFFADIFASSGMKIVLSGTDSLGFRFASSSSLFDRCIFLHTTFIPYAEFERVLGVKGIDNYIAYGGTMCLGGGDYNKSPFFEEESRREEYLDSAIASNIEHSLKCYKGGYFRDLYELYEKQELTNLISRVVEDSNHRFALEVFERDFHSQDLGISSANLRNEKDDFYHVLDRVDKKKVTERLKEMLLIKDKAEREVEIEEAHRLEIKEYLEALDLVVDVDVRSAYEISKKRKRSLFAVPGLRYAQAKALLSSLLLEPEFASLSAKERNLVEGRILSEIKGRMMEDIVLLETKLALPKKDVFKLEFPFGEFDMVISDLEKLTCEVYEVKHSEEIVKGQSRHLENGEMLAKTSFRYGEITRRAVLYRGESRKLENGIEYINVEEYLRGLRAKG